MAKQKPVLKNKPFVLIIRDGWGYNPNPEEDKYNAVRCADTPVDDMLMAEYPFVLRERGISESGQICQKQ